ncbi:hypothetical protein JOM56_009658 [Amanita muscaria]
MKFCAAPMLLASAGYFAAVLSFPLVDNSGGANGLNDGYVNTTVTTANAPPQGFTKRQNQQALSLVMKSLNGVVNDHKFNHRSQFAPNVVTALWNSNPHYNYVICHVPHDYTFQGMQGVDWDHQEQVGYSVSFDIVVGGAGHFIRHGDGGFINWAYIGNVASRTEIGGSTMVVFNAPSSS